MDLFLLFCYIFIGRIDLSSSRKHQETTLNVQERVALLKLAIEKQINQKPPVADSLPEENTPVNENIEYVDRTHDMLTPISEKDPRKKKNQFKLNEIKTTRDLGQNFRHDEDVFERKRHKVETKPSVKKIGRSRMLKKSHITDVFYRRIWESDRGGHWTHCQDLITPFLTGQKINITSAKRIPHDANVVVRLIQLITEDVTDNTNEDIQAILYQISNLQLRLYQWDLAAIQLLVNALSIGATSSMRSFKTLKHGMQALFKSWKFDFGTDVSMLLKETRMFRPPCVKLGQIEGSTMSSKTIRYTKSVKPKCRVQEGDDDDNCVAQLLT